MVANNLTHLRIITPTGVFFDGDVSIVTVRTLSGEMGILRGKSPIITPLAIADLYIGPKSDKKQCAISGGVMQANQTSVLIITDAIEYKDKIDLERAERARTQAELRLKQKISESEEAEAQLALMRAINRINVRKS